jgi:hypothetical protein
MRRIILCTLLALAFGAGAAYAKTYKINADVNADVAAQIAFANAQAGDSIRFNDGRFELVRPLTLNASGVDIRGEGPARTILSFRGSAAPGDGMSVRGDHIQIRDLTVEDAKGDAISVSGSNIIVQNVGARWATGAGVKVVDANNVIVRASFADGSGTGFTLQNAARVELADSEAKENGIGVEIVNRPGGPIGGLIRVIGNKISGNAGKGIGIEIVAVRDVALIKNEISEHGTANIFVRAYGDEITQAGFNALPGNITIMKNGFGRAGFAPNPDWAPATANGAVFGDIVWDGARSFFAGVQPATAPVLFAIRDNSTTTGALPRFLSLGLQAAGSPASEAQPSAQWPLIATFEAPPDVRIN